MNNHVRQRIYEWLLEITSNLTTFDQRENENSQINFSVNDHIELTTNMDVHSDTTKFFLGLNLSQFNITPDYLESFLRKLNLSKLHPVTHYDTCDDYCNGSFRDALLGYRSFHGYISLVVGLHYYKNAQFRKFDKLIMFHSGMYIWNNSQHSEYHCPYTKGHEQNSN